jgi:hypothetical protein
MSRNRTTAWLWAGATVMTVAIVAGVGWWKLQPPAPVASTQPTTRPGLLAGHDYYVFVKLIELRPARADGSRWDTGNDSAPDITFSLFWQSAKIFTGTERPDSLIANWDLFRVDLKDVLTNGGKLDVANSINAPLVHAGPDGVIRIEVWDDDPVGSDLADTIDLKMSDLKSGSNLIEPGTSSAVKRIVVELIDRNLPLQDLVDLQTRR